MLTNTNTFSDALMRHFIGLDHLNRFHQGLQEPNYPPFNIEKIGDDNYVLSLAVAGFAKDEITISLLNGQLKIEGSKSGDDKSPSTYLHRGLSFRNFSRIFSLAEHIQVVAAGIEDGMLTIALERQVPEYAKPRNIPIGMGAPKVTALDNPETTPLVTEGRGSKVETFCGGTKTQRVA